MKTLFIGGIKSGKSRLAEAYLLENAKTKPLYLATTEFIDAELQERIEIHKQRRKAHFNTIEEPMKLYDTIKNCQSTVLIECVSMWINNMLYYEQSEARIFQEISSVLDLPNGVVFVQNEVGFGIIAEQPLVRKFVDISGKISQLLAERCDNVYFCCAGLTHKLK